MENRCTRCSVFSSFGRGGSIMNENDGMHLIPVGNKIYHAEMYIKDTEIKKVKIKEAIRQLELYFEENKRDIEWAELGKSRRHLKDALYFLNKIKECVENDV